MAQHMVCPPHIQVSSPMVAEDALEILGFLYGNKPSKHSLHHLCLSESLFVPVQKPHLGRPRSHRALRLRHSSQAKPGCCRNALPSMLAMITMEDL